MTTPELLMIASMFMIHLAEDAADDAASGVEIVRAMLVVLGIVIFAAMLVMRNMHRIAQRKSDQPTAREQIEQAKSGRRATALPRRTERASADQVDEARHLATLLDNKAERLDQLLSEAELRIAELQKLVERVAANDSAADRQPAATDHSADKQHQASNNKPVDPLTRSVYELADQGHSSVEIAQQLDEQVGKIDLILALRG